MNLLVKSFLFLNILNLSCKSIKYSSFTLSNSNQLEYYNEKHKYWVDLYCCNEAPTLLDASLTKFIQEVRPVSIDLVSLHHINPAFLRIFTTSKKLEHPQNIQRGIVHGSSLIHKNEKNYFIKDTIKKIHDFEVFYHFEKIQNPKYLYKNTIYLVKKDIQHTFFYFTSSNDSTEMRNAMYYEIESFCNHKYQILPLSETYRDTNQQFKFNYFNRINELETLKENEKKSFNQKRLKLILSELSDQYLFAGALQNAKKSHEQFLMLDHYQKPDSCFDDLYEIDSLKKYILNQKTQIVGLNYNKYIHFNYKNIEKILIELQMCGFKKLAVDFIISDQNSFSPNYHNNYFFQNPEFQKIIKRAKSLGFQIIPIYSNDLLKLDSEVGASKIAKKLDQLIFEKNKNAKTIFLMEASFFEPNKNYPYYFELLKSKFPNRHILINQVDFFPKMHTDLIPECYNVSGIHAKKENKTSFHFKNQNNIELLDYSVYQWNPNFIRIQRNHANAKFLVFFEKSSFIKLGWSAIPIAVREIENEFIDFEMPENMPLIRFELDQTFQILNKSIQE